MPVPPHVDARTTGGARRIGVCRLADDASVCSTTDNTGSRVDTLPHLGSGEARKGDA
jgi:hypothetical protein